MALAVYPVHGQNETCCFGLRRGLAGKVHLPGDPGYEGSLRSYFSLQERNTTPYCIVFPTTAADVSTALAYINTAARNGKDCKFAVRSGGHSGIGSANIEDGITIDLSPLKDIMVAADRKQVRIGAGNRWGEVYSKLDDLGIAVPGGHASGVGVGGLTLGGGMSHFSPRSGFVCDTVLNYEVSPDLDHEVVLGSGAIIDANASSHFDLFRALKGGANNFGVVTRFDLEATEQTLHWGGTTVHSISHRSSVLDSAFIDFATDPSYDPYASMIHNYDWSANTSWLIINNIHYTNATPYPDAFRRLLDIPLLSNSTLRTAPLTSFTDELARSDSPGKLNNYGTLTVRPDSAMLNRFLELNMAAAESLKAIEGLTWNVLFQALPSSMLTNKGPNVLGLDATDAPLINLFAAAGFYPSANSNATANFDTVSATIESVIADATAEAKRLGVWHPFVYLPYAARWQDPIGSYGKENVEFLRRVSRKYDPRGVFQRLVPGGFKLW